MYFFRSFSILCAITALIAVIFWIGDKITRTQFSLGWMLAGSTFWMIVSWSVYLYLKGKHSK